MTRQRPGNWNSSCRGVVVCGSIRDPNSLGAQSSLQAVELCAQRGWKRIAEVGVPLFNAFDLGCPFVLVDRYCCLNVSCSETVQAGQIQGITGRHVADDGFLGVRGAFNALYSPLQHTRVVAEAWPCEATVSSAAEPVDQEDLWHLLWVELCGDLVPVVQVVAGVVADEWQHRHWVAADLAGGTRGSSRGFRGQGRAHEDAVGPAACLGDQRDGGLAAATEQDCIDLHAIRRVVVSGEHVDLVDWSAEARV